MMRTIHGVEFTIYFAICFVATTVVTIARADDRRVFAAHEENGVVVDVEFFGPSSWLSTPGARLNEFAQLKSIWITTNNIDVKAMSYIASLKTVEKITFGDSAEEKLRFEPGALNELAVLTGLKELEVNAVPLPAEEWKFLSNLKSLEILSVDGIDVSGMKYIENNPTLEYLCLVGVSANEIPPSVSTLPSLQTLLLFSRNSPTPHGADEFRLLRDIRRLAALDIEAIDSEGIEAISSLSKLRTLSVRVTEDVIDLGPLSKLTDLTFLSIDCKRFASDSFTKLSSLQNLETLLLRFPAMNVASSIDFPDGSLPQLKRLRLPYRCDAAMLRSLAKLPNLSELICRGIAEDGLEIKKNLVARGVRIELEN